MQNMFFNSRCSVLRANHLIVIRCPAPLLTEQCFNRLIVMRRPNYTGIPQQNIFLYIHTYIFLLRHTPCLSSSCISTRAAPPPANHGAHTTSQKQAKHTQPSHRNAASGRVFCHSCYLLTTVPLRSGIAAAARPESSLTENNGRLNGYCGNHFIQNVLSHTFFSDTVTTYSSHGFFILHFRCELPSGEADRSRDASPPAKISSPHIASNVEP
jgi:hypothetical protein